MHCGIGRHWTVFTAALAAALLVCPSAAAAAEATGDKSIDPGDLGQAVASVVIFLGLLAVLGRYAWKPVIAQLRQREQNIAATIARAQKQEQDAQDLVSHYRGQLDEAETETQAILARGREEAAQAREQILAEAKNEARRHVESARLEIQQARTDAQRELYQAAASMTADVARRVLRRSLSPEEHQRLIDESLEEIARQLEEGRPR